MKNKFILFLTFITFLVLGYPLFISGIEKSFYISVDPDIVYVSNALLYTKSAVITYADHPGTPTIMLLYYLFFPLRIIEKYIVHQSFIQWSFDNYTFLTYYVRFFQLVLYSLSIFIFLKLVKKISKSIYLTIFAWMAILSFAGSHYALFICPENFSFFLTIIWLTFFLKFIKKPSYFLSVLLAIVSGFALANKFTNIFLLIPSLAMPFFITKSRKFSNLCVNNSVKSSYPVVKLRSGYACSVRRFIRNTKLVKKFVGLGFNFLISIFSFYVGILPAIIRLDYITQWALTLFYHAEIHGTGKLTIFDWNAYSLSAVSLIKGNLELVIFLCVTIVLAIYIIIKKKIKIINPVILLFLNSVVGIIVFAKYPNIHYNYVNITLLIFCSVFFLSKTKLSVLKVLLLFITVVFALNIRSYKKGKLEHLERTDLNNVYSVLNVWTTSFWTGNLFREQLNLMGFTVP